jgi:hypothetical protein
MPESITNSDLSNEIGVSKESEVQHYETSLISIEDESPQSYNNPFLNNTFKEKAVKLYEDTQYECRSRFDENFRWTTKEQRKLTHKLDLRVALVACICFAALQMDRSNLGQAVSDNMLKDLHLTTNNYNTGNTIFYVCFLAAELPSQLISKKLGSDVWIPIQMTLWSIVTICQFKLSGKSSFYATRALLGLCEGGFIPDLVLWLSYFYTGAELSIRLSFFWTSMYATNIFNYLIAYGILHMRGVKGHTGWQWLFLIEGLITLVIGISAFFLMVPSPVQTKRWFNKKGWFTEREEKIVVNKVLRDDPTKGDMHNRQGLNLKMLYQALSDWHLWPMYLIGIVAYIPEGTVSSYMTLLLRGMGFSVFHTNLLCIPYNFLKIIILLAVTYFSERFTNIFGIALIQPFWNTICYGVLRFWPGNYYNKWGTYGLLTVTLADPYIHAMMVSACSRNSQSIKTRTVSASIYNMFVQSGSIIASNIYRTGDKPLYHTGNSVLFALSLAMFPILIGTKLFYYHLNKRREKIWDAMSEDEKDDYIKHTTDRGSSRLNYRFAH